MVAKSAKELAQTEFTHALHVLESNRVIAFGEGGQYRVPLSQGTYLCVKVPHPQRPESMVAYQFRYPDNPDGKLVHVAEHFINLLTPAVCHVDPIIKS
jgi:hypothetical protein